MPSKTANTCKNITEFVVCFVVSNLLDHVSVSLFALDLE